MKELLINLNQTIKEMGAAFFSDLIVSNKHNPRFLFTINQLVTPSPPAIHASSPADCEKFLSFFIGKIDSIWSNFTLFFPLQCSVVLFYCLILLMSLYKSFQKL